MVDITTVNCTKGAASTIGIVEINANFAAVKTAVDALETYAIPEKTPVNAVAARGEITMTGVAVADEIFAVAGQTYTWKAARGGTGEVTIGANVLQAVTNIVNAIAADQTNVTAHDGGVDNVFVTAATKGVAGNSLIFMEAATNMAVDGTGTLGATIAGVDGTVGVANELCADASYIYHAIATNTITDNNWRREGIGSVY